MLRTLLNFFLVGGALFALQSAVVDDAPAGPEITVRVSANASDAQVEKEIGEAILLNEARRYHWDRQDPVVYTHLVRNMRFVEPDTTVDDITLFRRALELGMQERDPIVRERLLYRARKALSVLPKEQMPTKEQLRAHLEAHPERFEREGLVRFGHVFLSRSKRGDSLAADAEALATRLPTLSNEDAHALGDPLPGVRATQSSSPATIKKTYGLEMANAIALAPIEVWEGPVRSVYGLHFVRVQGRDSAFVPPVAEIEPEVRADLVGELQGAQQKKRIAELRSAYAVNVVKEP